MSKAAVAMMTKLFAIRLAPNGIAVYGPLRYDSHADDPRSSVAFRQAACGGLYSINRWCRPEDVGRAVATMAAGELPFTTGTAIQVDGGMHIHQY